MFRKIVVGYIPTKEGVAALDAAIEIAKDRGAHLTVVNTGRDGNYADPSFATAEDIDTIDLQRARPPPPPAAPRCVRRRAAARRPTRSSRRSRSSVPTSSSSASGVARRSASS